MKCEEVKITYQLSLAKTDQEREILKQKLKKAKEVSFIEEDHSLSILC